MQIVDLRQILFQHATGLNNSTLSSLNDHVALVAIKDLSFKVIYNFRK